MTLPKFLTTAELAESLQVTERTIINMRANGTGPAFVLIGRAIRYPPRSIQEWLDTCKQDTSTSSKGTPASSKGTPRRAKAGRS